MHCREVEWSRDNTIRPLAYLPDSLPHKYIIPPPLTICRNASCPKIPFSGIVLHFPLFSTLHCILLKQMKTYLPSALAKQNHPLFFNFFVCLKKMVEFDFQFDSNFCFQRSVGGRNCFSSSCDDGCEQKISEASISSQMSSQASSSCCSNFFWFQIFFEPLVNFLANIWSNQSAP